MKLHTYDSGEGRHTLVQIVLSRVYSHDQLASVLGLIGPAARQSCITQHSGRTKTRQRRKVALAI